MGIKLEEEGDGYFCTVTIKYILLTEVASIPYSCVDKYRTRANASRSSIQMIVHVINDAGDLKNCIEAFLHLDMKYNLIKIKYYPHRTWLNFGHLEIIPKAIEKGVIC